MANSNARKLMWGPKTKGLRPMSFAGSKISSFFGSLRASKSLDALSYEGKPLSSRVTKAELKDLFDLNTPDGAPASPLMASERLQRQTTEIIRNSMYKSE